MDQDPFRPGSFASKRIRFASIFKTPADARSRRPTARGRKQLALPRHIEIRQHRLAATIGTVAKQARTRAGTYPGRRRRSPRYSPRGVGRMERGK